VKNYDLQVTPNPAAWLKLDEKVQIQLVRVYHMAAGIKLPNLKANAAFHAIVDNQIAEGHAPAVRAITRLIHEGLSCSGALHAISSVVADHFFEAMNTKDEDFARIAQARYDAAVERLSAKAWRRRKSD
jgi:hypothetical protein